MVNCKRCGHIFENRHKLIRHLKNRYICDNNYSNIDIETYINELQNETITMVKDDIKLYLCKYCKKPYRSSSSRCVHQTKCKENDKNNNTVSLIDNNSNTNIVNNMANVINNTNIDNSINNNNNITNNGVLVNVGGIDIKNINDLNDLITKLKLNNKIKSFPTYTVGHVVENKGTVLSKKIKKCKREDEDPKTSHSNRYNFSLEIFKTILESDDYRTKNTFIANVTDKIAYCYLDDRYYSVSLDVLFNIIFQHLPNLIQSVLKLKDRHSSLPGEDEYYTRLAHNEFKDYLETTEMNERTEIKKEIINCLYKNKLVLQDLLNSATPLDKFKNLEKTTVTFTSNLMNMYRVKSGVDAIDNNKDMIIEIHDKTKKYRKDNSVITKIENEYEITITNPDEVAKVTSNGFYLYKAKYRNIDILYNEIHQLGIIDILPNKEVIKKDTICNIIDNILNIEINKEDIIES